MIDYFAGAQVVPESEWTEYRGLSAVYVIRHTDSGKFYVGSAVDLYRRWKQHRHTLNTRTHRNRKLQNAWNKYGKTAFEFLIVESSRAEEVLAREQEWLDKTKATEVGYNFASVAGSLLGFRHTDEAKARMATSKVGTTRTDEVKSRISAANTGLKRSAEHRAAVSAAHRGKKQTPERAAKAAAARTAVGRQHSQDTKAKLSELATGRKRSAESIAKGAATATGKKRSLDAIAKSAASNMGKKRSHEFKQRMSEIRTGKPLSEAHKETLVDALYTRSPVNESNSSQIKGRYVSRDLVNGARALSKEFGLSYSTVMKIVHGKHGRYT